MTPNQVVTIDYRCRDIGYGVEEGTIEAFWTGDVDWIGKLTVRPVDGSPTMYLFEDEILDRQAKS